MDSQLTARADDVSVDMHDLITATNPLSTIIRPSPSPASQRNRPRSRRLRPSTRAEKDVDDLAGTLDESRLRVPRLTATSNAVNQLFSPTSPTSSRESSYLRKSWQRAHSSDSITLPVHLYTSGLMNGKHSDIIVNVFGKQLALHRIILDRSQFFATALSEPWLEANAREIDLHPEEVDLNITETGFDTALKRLYGVPDHFQEEEHAIELLAVGCWLEMRELVETSVANILKNLKSTNVAEVISVVTHSYYGKAGERVLSAAKTLLLRDGWNLPLHLWDDVPSEVVRDVISADEFFVCTEWDRWAFAKTILDRRLKRLATDSDLFENLAALQSPLSSISDVAIRPASSSGTAISGTSSTMESTLVKLYDHVEIQPLLLLLDHGIHYPHFAFEQLSAIRESRDIFGVPVMPERLVTDALWVSMELRSKVQSAAETDTELGIAGEATRCSLRQFEIPQNDRAISGSSTANDLLAGLNSGRDVDISAQVDNMSEGNKQTTSTVPTSIVSKFPPLRFGAVFPNERSLKEKKKVFSQPLFYAGNWWRMYAKRDRSRKNGNPELGIYLHRADKFKADGEIVIPGTSVDEMIGVLERDMRRDGRPFQRQQLNELTQPGNTAATSRGQQSSTQAIRPLFGMSKGSSSSKADDTVQAPLSDSESDSPTDKLIPRPTVSSAKPYDDRRPLAKAYFKFYSHSRYEPITNVFESAPDSFDFAHSKGWKLEEIYSSQGWLSPEGDNDEAEIKIAAIDDQSIVDKRLDPSSDGKMRFIAIVGMV